MEKQNAFFTNLERGTWKNIVRIVIILVRGYCLPLSIAATAILGSVGGIHNASSPSLYSIK